MSRTIKIVLGVSILLNLLYLIHWQQDFSSPEKAELRVCVGKASVKFSPSGGVEASLIKLIDESKKSIYVLAYSFTSEPIAKALVKAHARGVYVEVIVDGRSIFNRHCQAKLVESAGVNIWIDKAHPIAHNKTLLIDERYVATGSYNFSNAAELNAENSLILDCPALYESYRADYKHHREHSEDLAEMVTFEIQEPIPTEY